MFPDGLKKLSSNKSPTGKPLAIHVGAKAEWRVYQLIAERQPSETYSQPYNNWLPIGKSGNARPWMPDESFPMVYARQLYFLTVQINGRWFNNRRPFLRL